MRTALFFVALAIRDVAEALGTAPLSDFPDSVQFIGTLILAAMIMDVVDFMRGRK